MAGIDESWTTQNEDWVMVDSGAGVTACPVDCASSVVQSNYKSLVLEAIALSSSARRRSERGGANVEIVFEAAKVRRPLLSVDS